MKGKAMSDDEENETLSSIAAIIERHDAAALGGSTSAMEAAQKWIDADYDDAEEIAEWLAARCFTPEGASRLESAGLTPEQASFRTRAGSGDYEDSLAYKLISGDLAFDEVRRIITREFWKEDAGECP